jgi:tetratricopeptide (TPR) repeat protein
MFPDYLKYLLNNHLKWFLFFGFILTASNIYADQVEELMKLATEYYRSGEYDKAIETYEELVSEGYEGAALYYNLGNSYFRIGKLGHAILNYERALRISPSDDDIKHNLTFAYLNTSDRIDPLPDFFLFEWWESMLSSLSVNGWTYTVFSVYLILLLIIVLYFFARTIFQQKIILFTGLGVLAILALIVSLLIVKVNREETHINGIILEQAVTVKTSPDLKSTDAFLIHEGLKVKLEDNLDEWVKIRLADGKVGWVESSVVERI